MRYNNILDSVGHTPHIRLANMFPDNEVWVKDERRNPGGSLKDRVAISMIEDAELSGKLKPGGVIVEPTSGNTGIGLAMVGMMKKYKVILVMPESMSMERRRLLAAYGAEIVLTSKDTGMKGAVDKAEEIVAKMPEAWMPMQFSNPANIDVHVRITAREIMDDFPAKLDFLVAGVGSAGHITGLGRALKKKYPNIKIVAVEPDTSPVLSGGKAGSHLLQGIGPGFVPDNYDSSIIDDVMTVSGDDAYCMTRRLVREEGILAGISTGANMAAIKTMIGNQDISRTDVIMTIVYDSGERYLSCEGLF